MKEIKIGDKIEQLQFEDLIPKFKGLLHREAYKWINTYDYDELYQLALIGLWKAYRYYKLPYQFYTTAVMCIRSEIGQYHKKMSKLQTTSFEAAVFTGKNGEEISLEDMLGEVDDNIEYYAERELKKKILSKLSKKQIDEIAYLVLGDITQKELAKKYEVSQSNFSKKAQDTLDRVRLIYLKELNLS